MEKIKFGKTVISKNSPTYFIADIAANHDGDIKRAKKLIKLAADSGANAVKFQHHDVKKYVSDFGFKNLGDKFSHQKQWKKSIFEVYKDAEVPLNWTKDLKEFSDEIGIDFLSTPYDLEMVDHLDPYVTAFKIGSGDVNWFSMLEKVASKGKPVIIATGASTMQEVLDSVTYLKKFTDKIILMQCNTNYTGSDENLKYINLNVLKTYRIVWPEIILGLSDHTPGDITVLGATALGSTVVEKHFTDDTGRDGPDHKFSMDPKSWKAMVDNTRRLESSLGSTIKKVEENEFDTVVLQRRAIRVVRDINKGHLLTKDDVEFQRPCPKGSMKPNEITNVIGKVISKDIKKGQEIYVSLLKGDA